MNTFYFLNCGIGSVYNAMAVTSFNFCAVFYNWSDEIVFIAICDSLTKSTRNSIWLLVAWILIDWMKIKVPEKCGRIDKNYLPWDSRMEQDWLGLE